MPAAGYDAEVCCVPGEEHLSIIRVSFKSSIDRVWRSRIIERIRSYCTNARPYRACRGRRDPCVRRGPYDRVSSSPCFGVDVDSKVQGRTWSYVGSSDPATVMRTDLVSRRIAGFGGVTCKWGARLHLLHNIAWTKNNAVLANFQGYSPTMITK